MKRIFFLVFTILFISTSCSAQSEREHSEPTCSASFSSVKGLPESVLAGTDVVELSSFTFSRSNVNEIKNSYSAEFGGATLVLRIIQTKNDKSMARDFQEPGDTKKTKLYEPLCKTEEFLSADNLKGIIVDNGLLLLEEKPEVDGIPSDLWVYYKSTDS